MLIDSQARWYRSFYRKVMIFNTKCVSILVAFLYWVLHFYVYHYVVFFRRFVIFYFTLQVSDLFYGYFWNILWSLVNSLFV